MRANPLLLWLSLLAIALPLGCGRNQTSPLEAASELLFLKDYPAALAKCDDVLAESPTNVEALLLRGQIYQRAGKTDEATVDFTRAIELEPRNPDGYFFRHKLYKELGELEKYMSDYAHYKELDPTAAIAYPTEFNTATPELHAAVARANENEESAPDPFAIKADEPAANEETVSQWSEDAVAKTDDEEAEGAKPDAASRDDWQREQQEANERVRAGDLADDDELAEPLLPPHMESPELAPELEPSKPPTQITRFGILPPSDITGQGPAGRPLGPAPAARTTGIRSDTGDSFGPATGQRERFSRVAPVGTSYPTLPSTGIRGPMLPATGIRGPATPYGTAGVEKRRFGTALPLGGSRTFTTGISSVPRETTPAGTATTSPGTGNPFLSPPPRGTPILTMALPGTTILQGGVKATNSTALGGRQIVPAPTLRGGAFTPYPPRPTGQSMLTPSP